MCKDIIEVSAETFYEEFRKRKHLIKNSECVILRDLEYYQKNCTLFLMSSDYGAGAALAREGRIVSVFKASGRYSIGKDLVNEIIKRGGKKLECVRKIGLLTNIYFKVLGFIPVSNSPLDKNYVDWDKLDAIPKTEDENATEIMYCFYSSELKAQLQKEEILSKLKPDFSRVRHFDNEQEAEEHRDEILNNIKIHKGYINSIVGFRLYA